MSSKLINEDPMFYTTGFWMVLENYQQCILIELKHERMSSLKLFTTNTNVNNTSPFGMLPVHRIVQY